MDQRSEDGEVDRDTPDDDLAEDLRRARPNPPMTAEEADPESRIDLGYMEDREEERDAEELRDHVSRKASDPLEADREAEEEPGPSAGPPPGEAP